MTLHHGAHADEGTQERLSMPDPTHRPMVDFSVLDSHERIALLFSGGKDSLALVYLFREHWDRLTVVHLDHGDLLPEMRELVAQVETMVPRFHRISTNAPAWIASSGLLPSQLVPVKHHPVLRRAGDEGPFTVPSFDCCSRNKWQPTFDFLRDRHFTLAIIGQRRTDPVPFSYWNVGADPAGLEYLHPIEHWTDDQVFAYLREVGAPILRFYSHRAQGPECATCPAGWDEGRAEYLKRHHPELAQRYARYLEMHAKAMNATARHFLAERAALADVLP